MALRFTINRFPRDASMRDVTGLPWGAVVQPFVGIEQDPASTGSAVGPNQQGASGGSTATPSKGGTPLPPLRQVLTPSEDVARCEDCFAYINPYCTVDGSLWRCSLCGVVNTFSTKQLQRYSETSGGTSRKESCEELSNSMVEFDIASEAILASDALSLPPGAASPSHTLPNGHGSVAGTGSGAESAVMGWEMLVPKEELRKLPACVAVVDVAGSEELLELTKSSLLAALEALPPCALFGLATFSDTIGMYDLQGEVPVARHVPIPADPKAPLSVDLQDVLPLAAFLAPVGQQRYNIAASLETLRPARPLPTTGAKAAQGAPGKHPGRGPSRGFGTAMSALVAYLGGTRKDTAPAGPGAEGGHQAFVSARALVFLGGRPDYGQGALAGDRYFLSQQSADTVDGDRLLFKDQTTFYHEVAAAAVQAGVSIDLFAVAGEAPAEEPPVDPSVQPGQNPPQLSAQPSSGTEAEDASYFDLATLSALTRETGGSLFRYSSAEDATLPQDVYRMLSRPQALSGVLRLRTSREFSAVRAYGKFFRDSQFDDLYHIFRSDPYDSYCFDFEYSSSAGFPEPSPDTTGPVVQMAFQYTVIVPPHTETAEEEPAEGAAGEQPGPAGTGPGRGAGEGAEGGAQGNGVAAGSRLPVLVPKYDMFGRLIPPSQREKQEQALAFPGAVVRRILRVQTIQLSVAEGPQDLYESADNEAILAVLMHKIIRASTEEGVLEGRLLIRDWLVILTAHYNDTFKLAQFGQPASVTRLDVAFAACPQLQPIPRLVFALLRSPILQFHREGVHPDLRTYLQCLFETLDPAFLMRAIYPMLSSYVSPDRTAFPRHSLSQAALITSGSPIFLLDAFTTIVVFYAPNASPDLPYPPPQGSLLRSTVNKLKAERIITPRTFFVRGSTDGTHFFEQFLIEEQDVDGLVEGGATGMGFVSYLEGTALEVREYMK